MILTTIRDKGLCPCLRCLIPNTKLDRVGRIANARIRTNQARKYQDIAESVKKARTAIYEEGVPITGAYVQRLLKHTSTVPTLASSYILSFGTNQSAVILTIYLVQPRMHLSSNLAVISIHLKCS